MKQQQETDEDLFEAARRVRGKGQCGSVIVATDAAGERNYHLCSGDDKRDHPTHYCGCGQEWVGSMTAGPLTDVVFRP